MAKREISRLDAVCNQINSAIRAYFLWDDLVSALTLAGAAERVLSDKQPADGILGVDAFSIRAMVNLYIEDAYQSKAAKLFRADYDFFRHADQKPQDDYEFSERWVDFQLLLSIGSYEFLGQKKTEDIDNFHVLVLHEISTMVEKDHPF